MRILLKIDFLLFFILLSGTSIAQSSIRDSSINMSILGFNYSFTIPAEDLSERFGPFSQIGASYSFKFSNQFILGTSFHFMYGTSVKEQNIFSHISTSESYLIDNQGLLTPISQELRGFNFDFRISYLIPVLGPNPNSGIFFGVGTGFLQHKIFHSYLFGPLPQIEGDYSKGYDRLTNGSSIIQQIGYYRFNNKNLGSFHVLISVHEGFTKNRRDLNFDTMIQDSRKRMDVFYGITLGLDLPFYTRSPGKFYIN